MNVKHESIGEQIKELREKCGLTRRELAKKLKKKPLSFEQYLYKLETGKVKSPGINLLNQILKALENCLKAKKVDQEIQEKLEYLYPVKLAKNVKVGAGNSSYPIDEVYTSTNLLNKDVHAIKVSGDSMEPLIKDGDYVVINLNDKDIKDGGIYAISEIEGGLLLRRIEKNKNRLVLTPLNPKYKPKKVFPTEINIIGRAIIAITQRYL